jgi:hypothetical protein
MASAILAQSSGPCGLLDFGEYGLSVGDPADIVIFGVADPAGSSPRLGSR